MMREYEQESGPLANLGISLRQTTGIVAVIAVLGLTMLAGKIVENVPADEIVVIQSVFGNLDWYTTPGPKPQLFGKVTRYKKRSIYKFTKKVRFNDGGHADMVGSIQYDMPMDEKNLNSIHAKFSHQEGVQNQLITTVVDKCTYMTGPTMSSKESYAEKRNLLIWYVEDQVTNGIYRTKQTEKVTKDPITETEKTVTTTEIVTNQATQQPERLEAPVLAQFGIKPFNFAITDLTYDPVVEKQIATQQQATMDVQIAMAEAKKADQRKLTVEAEGAATAAKSRWEQEAEKARETTKAEQEKAVEETGARKRLAVATFDAQAAEQKKRESILLGEGEAERKKLVMNADGALQLKTDTYLKAVGLWASALSEYRGNWVPQVVMGDAEKSAGGGAQQLINMLSVKTAKDLALDLSMTGADKTKN